MPFALQSVENLQNERWSNESCRMACDRTLMVAVVGWIAWSAGRHSESQLSSVRQELQSSLAAQNQAITSQINGLMLSVTQQLGPGEAGIADRCR